MSSNSKPVPCPSCRRTHDLIVYFTGDIIICRCGARLRVYHEADGTSWVHREEPRR